ncbi:serine/threonine protein kinase [Gemmata sp. G18]|uniref:Serine/threonine protein kinase n=1 Tax=Gemmata palustris TaxID=2822762 RepID=A0ABS5C133_9BACT|nr:serine/threonine-protein kinase [Gemmata palustris]MBP3959165.1 serine/threonine protein kinase [Gemmata palustris]
MQTTHTLTDRDALLEAASAAGLLSPNQLQKAADRTAAGPARAAARVLVAAGLLTQFQVDRLLAGRTDGFRIGQYVVLDQVGRGSKSCVYKAKHQTMHRSVAIKVFAADLTRTTEERQAFQDAVHAAGKLSHPNIVTAFDANELHDRFYLVLELVDGPGLDALVRQHGPLPVGEACEIVRQIAHGLNHAHDHAMVHGALEPSGILVTRAAPMARPTVKIANFGVPRFEAGLPDFTAPEQLRKPSAADARADLYSLGCVFYFLLTGHAPFTSGTPEETVRRQLLEDASRIERLRPDVPPDVGAIVHRLLMKLPGERFASAADLLAHLDAAHVPTACPVGYVSFDMPVAAPYPYDSGYLTGHYVQPDGSGAYPMSHSGFGLPVVPSPWEQITDDAVCEVTAVDLGATPAPPKVLRPPSGRRGPGPLWTSAALLVGAVLLSMMGIGAVVRLMAK